MFQKCEYEYNVIFNNYFYAQGRELLMRMLQVFVLKFQTIAEIQLPVLMQKW